MTIKSTRHRRRLPGRRFDRPDQGGWSTIAIYASEGNRAGMPSATECDRWRARNSSRQGLLGNAFDGIRITSAITVDSRIRILVPT